MERQLQQFGNYLLHPLWFFWDRSCYVCLACRLLLLAPRVCYMHKRSLSRLSFSCMCMYVDFEIGPHIVTKAWLELTIQPRLASNVCQFPYLCPHIWGDLCPYRGHLPRFCHYEWLSLVSSHTTVLSWVGTSAPCSELPKAGHLAARATAHRCALSCDLGWFLHKDPEASLVW